MSEDEILVRLKEELILPSGDEICLKAMTKALGDRIDNNNWIKANFSLLVEKIQIMAYEIYLTAERPAAVKAISTVLGKKLKPNATKDDFFRMLENNFWALDKFFLGLTQGRRPRAGKAFETIIKVLFNKLGYPYTPQAVINGQPDFLLPSLEHFRENPMDCIIFTVKRTLRERWRQITTEGTHGHQFFLATIDENIAARDLPDMLRNRIYLVVPEILKTNTYSNHQNVISFETFFHQHLDPAMNRWRANAIIE